MLLNDLLGQGLGRLGRGVGKDVGKGDFGALGRFNKGAVGNCGSDESTGCKRV